MTARGCTENEFEQIAEFIREACELTKDYKKNSKKLADFKAEVWEQSQKDQRMIDLRNRVIEFSSGLKYFYEDQLN